LEDKKMKRLVTLLLALVMVFSLVACGSGEKAASADYKIGIITGTVSQGEEEYQAAQNLKAKYGDKVVTATYPDNFSTETEQTIATVTNMAADPDVKAIVFVQAVPGAAAAINKVKETRDDILFVTGVCAEDPAVIAAAADICMLVDEISMGNTIIEQAAKQGAKTFVHVSFERHLGYATIAARQALFKENCARLGLEYVEATAPDPTGDAGVTGAQAWVTENIKVYVDQYGKDTAFFSTNCSLQVPLIQQCAELGAVYPQQCCPSPYHGYPSAFNISTEGHEGDVPYMLEQIKAKVAEYGNTGRMSTWEVPVNMVMIEAGFNYAEKWIKGEITERCDEAALLSEIQAIAGEAASITKYSDEASGEIANFFMILCPFYDF
jgi:ABC-type sugar transport system substrate-binding protein